MGILQGKCWGRVFRNLEQTKIGRVEIVSLTNHFWIHAVCSSFSESVIRLGPEL